MRLILRRYSSSGGGGTFLNADGSTTGATSQAQQFTNGILSNEWVTIAAGRGLIASGDFHIQRTLNVFVFGSNATYFGTNATSGEMYFRDGDAVSGSEWMRMQNRRVGIGGIEPVSKLHIKDYRPGITNSVVDILTVRIEGDSAQSGFGAGVVAEIMSTTYEFPIAGRLTWAWETATHASRASKGQLSAYYTSTERPAITWGANSTVSLLSFHDVTTPIARPVLATGAGATADDIITVLQNYGLVKQS